MAKADDEAAAAIVNAVKRLIAHDFILVPLVRVGEAGASKHEATLPRHFARRSDAHHHFQAELFSIVARCNISGASARDHPQVGANVILAVLQAGREGGRDRFVESGYFGLAHLRQRAAEIHAHQWLPEGHFFGDAGGSALSSWLHLARTVVRRAERLIAGLAEAESINPQAIAYANRLSDHLFVMARYYNDKGKADVLWVPRKNR